MNNLEPCEVKKTPIAEIVLNDLGRLTTVAEALVEHLEHKLRPIYVETPKNPQGPTQTTAQEYPPLFAVIRDRMESIEKNLSQIRNIVNQCEI